MIDYLKYKLLPAYLFTLATTVIIDLCIPSDCDIYPELTFPVILLYMAITSVTVDSKCVVPS